MYATPKTPGVYREEIFPVPPVELRTSVPAFLGLTDAGKFPGEKISFNEPKLLTLWPQFEQFFQARPDSYLAYTVRGFFENGGRECYVIRLKNRTPAALEEGLAALASLNTIDLVCAPDIMRSRTSTNNLEEIRQMQAAVLRHCQRLGDRFAILDSLPQVELDQVQEQGTGLAGAHGALYYPWIRIADGPEENGSFVPPCGHVAGIYARSDERVGVYKAPANEIVNGALELEIDLTNEQQGKLNPQGINCLRTFPGRGIRVWGARTLSGDSNWRYINVRRIFLTAGRWIERHLADSVFEPNDLRLWARIRRELTAYFNDLFQQGALQGSSPEEAFYVKCDEETNPPEVRDRGEVVTEIGLVAALPGEFIIVRIIQSANGTTIAAGPL